LLDQTRHLDRNRPIKAGPVARAAIAILSERGGSLPWADLRKALIPLFPEKSPRVLATHIRREVALGLIDHQRAAGIYSLPRKR
jgi:hypothetical protein